MFARASRIGVLWIAAITLCCICISAQQITQECIGCICEVTSGCNTTLGCDGPVCGPFYITKAYWIDAGKPTKADDISNNNDDENYSNCAQDVYCAGRTVQNYMVKFKQDCNGDGVINCDDYVRLHRYGVSGCTNQLHSVYESIYKLCIDNFA
ncbi:lysozyme [Monomorium pharaonis]|uniref:lysozyme n=1 Tax=Monomorium pharaonis TaxID=307658 RepID=UPI001747187D|nr:lysozyme [Monomorium pharaonis]